MPTRVFIFAILGFAAVVYLLVVMNRPTEHKMLTETVWCADTIMVGVTRLQPNSFGIKADFKRSRVETFQLKSDGRAIFPGFNSEPVNAKWKTEDIYIEIYDADTFGNIYNGVYEFFLTQEFLKMVNEKVMISGSKTRAY